MKTMTETWKQPLAAIALLRLHAYTNDPGLRDKAEQTIELIAGLADQYGLFAATYGIAAVHLSHSHTQIVIVGSGERAEMLYKAAVRPFSATKAVLKLGANKAVPQSLPPALAETIPLAEALARDRAVATRLDRAAIERLTDPAHYLGSTKAFIDRVLAAARGMG